jgi:hypothetical protein
VIVPPLDPAQATFVDYYRCAVDKARLATAAPLSPTEGYFAFESSRCYGRPAGVAPLPEVTGQLPDVAGRAQNSRCGVVLLFDLAEVVTNLRQERYTGNGTRC